MRRRHASKRRGWRLWAPAGGAALLAAAAALWWSAGRSERPPDIVLITVESLRPDHVACLDGDRPTTPNLDALAAESVVYTDAHATTSWTLPSHASIFTGMYPTAHQTTGPLSRLGDSYVTIAEALAGEGYQCAAVISGPYLRKEHNLCQGFEYLDAAPAARSMSSAHEDVTNPDMDARLRQFLTTGRDPERPLLLFAYFWDPHYDYIPPKPFSEMFVTEDCEPIDLTQYEIRNTVHAGISAAELAWVKSQYDGEIRWTDKCLGRLFERLKELEIWENAIVIVTADHGEEFFDHGMKGHMNNLYVESVHVPLIVKLPAGIRKGRDSRLTSLVDLYPTILEAAGAAGDAPHQGLSLFGPAPDAGRAIFHELRAVRYFPRPDGGQESRTKYWAAMRRGECKFVKAPGEGGGELYNVRLDPRERRSIAGDEGARAAGMAGALESWQADMEAIASSFQEGGRAEVDEARIERLRALGYIR